MSEFKWPLLMFVIITKDFQKNCKFTALLIPRCKFHILSSFEVKEMFTSPLCTFCPYERHFSKIYVHVFSYYISNKNVMIYINTCIWRTFPFQGLKLFTPYWIVIDPIFISVANITGFSKLEWIFNRVFICFCFCKRL